MMQTRTGWLWGLEPGPSGGYSQLETIRTRVELAPASAAAEWLDVEPAGADGAQRDGGGGGAGDGGMRRAALVRMQAGGLRALLLEGCVLGWHLRGAEAGALSAPALLGLLTPRLVASG